VDRALLDRARAVSLITDSYLQVTIPSVLAREEVFAARLSCGGPAAGTGPVGVCRGFGGRWARARPRRDEERGRA
jgi:hypothetical protein